MTSVSAEYKHSGPKKCFVTAASVKFVVDDNNVDQPSYIYLFISEHNNCYSASFTKDFLAYNFLLMPLSLKHFLLCGCTCI